ncbi:MAG: hypothetical protein LBE22_05525 [Azoarcus sp.]|jgi:hypothetical protein|nr:hypothetical protein [Azoarcus sp.]
MNNKKTRLIFISTVAILTGCGDSGSKFEGKWSCETEHMGKLSVTIQHNEDNDYIIELFRNGISAEKGNVTYKDGELTAPEGEATLSIDKKSGKLVGFSPCEMSRDK